MAAPPAPAGRRPLDSGEEEDLAPAASYEDLLPVMGERLGTAGLMSELRAGFRLLADPARGAITPDSLRRGAAAALGVAGMTPAEARAMVREGDGDGDGALSESEFCVLMVRLSPGIMADAEDWLADAIEDEMHVLLLGAHHGAPHAAEDEDAHAAGQHDDAGAAAAPRPASDSPSV